MIESEAWIKKFERIIKKNFIVESQLILWDYFFDVFDCYIKNFHVEFSALMSNLKSNTSCFDIRLKSFFQNLLWNKLKLFWIFDQVHPIPERMFSVNIELLQRFIYQRKSADNFPSCFWLGLIWWLNHQNQFVNECFIFVQKISC